MVTLKDFMDKKAVADESGQRLSLGPAAITGDGVTDAAARTDPQQGPGWFVTVDFRDPGAWQRLTGAAACEPVGEPKRRLAIVLDNEIISSPQVDPSVPCKAGIPGGSTQITGSFTPQEAQDPMAMMAPAWPATSFTMSIAVRPPTWQ